MLADPSLDGSVGGSRPLFVVVLRFAGLPAGRTATLTVESDATLAGTLDPRCTRPQPHARRPARSPVTTCPRSRCSLVAPQGGQVTATLSPAEQDADIGNNTWRADLG